MKAKGKNLTNLARLYGIERRWYNLEPDFLLRGRVRNAIYEINSYTTTTYTVECKITFDTGEVLWESFRIASHKHYQEAVEQFLYSKYTNIKSFKVIDLREEL